MFLECLAHKAGDDGWMEEDKGKADNDDKSKPKSYFELVDEVITELVDRVVALEKWKIRSTNISTTLLDQHAVKIEELQHETQRIWSKILALDDDTLRRVESMAKILWEDRRIELESRKKLLEGLNRS
jgi:hypothetical protein